MRSGKPSSFARCGCVNKPPKFDVVPRRYYIHSESRRRVTLIPGDGIGPEITASTLGILQAAGTPLDFERFDHIDAGLSTQLLNSVARNRVLLKGPLYTQDSLGPISRNILIRRAFEQLVGVVPIKSIPSIALRHKDVDLVVIREQLEGEYSGLEHEILPGVVESIKITTASEVEKVGYFAFEYTKNNNRKKLTAVHKANIMKMTDGLFLDVLRNISKEYPDIEFTQMIIDNACMQLVSNPSQFDVIVTPNLYGNIVINVAAGLVGGPGIIPGASYGKGIAVFETGARHVARDISGKGVANPTALILSAVMMLHYLKLNTYADKISSAIDYVYEKTDIRTSDMGGKFKTSDFTYTVIKRLTG